jgi:hypothetical protein
VTFDVENDVGAVLGRLDPLCKARQRDRAVQLQLGLEDRATGLTQRWYESEPLACTLTRQSERRPRFDRAGHPEPDVGRRKTDTPDRLTERARVGAR